MDLAYRPQYVFAPAPPGWKDEEFEYVFDASTVPALASIVLAPGEELQNIVLPLQRDAAFRWRGIRVSNPGSSLGMRFRTPEGEYMSDGYEPMPDFSGFSQAAAALPGGSAVPIEPEVLCPAGSVILLDLMNLA